MSLKILEKVTIKRVYIFNLIKLYKVSKILFLCGKNMADKYDLHHWNNSMIKNILIVFYCVLRNKIFLIYSNKNEIATFQYRKNNVSIIFKKLAVHPIFEGKGIGKFCLQEIENICIKNNCNSIECEVYEKSEHAIRFYEKNGFHKEGFLETLKYKEIKMKKMR